MSHYKIKNLAVFHKLDGTSFLTGSIVFYGAEKKPVGFMYTSKTGVRIVRNHHKEVRNILPELNEILGNI